jgi:hypothetical protein
MASLRKCVHGRQASRCRLCGTGHCIHGRRSDICKLCGTGQCVHLLRKVHCRVCSPNAFCAHGRYKYMCRDCGGIRYCIHQRRTPDCTDCGGVPALVIRLWKNAKSRAKRWGLPFNITTDDLMSLLNNGENLKCPVFGTPFNLTSTKPSKTSASLDRFKSELGYVKGNCFIISHLANTIKTSATTIQVRLVADWMEKQESSNG